MTVGFVASAVVYSALSSAFLWCAIRPNTSFGRRGYGKPELYALIFGVVLAVPAIYCWVHLFGVRV